MHVLVETNPMANGARYYVARLDRSKKDYELFHTANTLCTREKTWKEVPNLKKVWAATATPEGSRAFWQEEFSAPNNVHFVLMKEGQSGQDFIAGVADISIPCRDPLAVPVFSSMHVLEAHRGQHLSDFLHAARVQHAVHQMPHNRADIYIEPDNHPALRAAARAGFAYRADGSFGLGERSFRIYSCDLQRLRSQAEAPSYPALEMEQNA